MLYMFQVIIIFENTSDEMRYDDMTRFIKMYDAQISMHIIKFIARTKPWPGI